MRLDVPPPPPAEELLRLTVHEIVRDFPESLAVFRSRDLSFRAFGAWTLARLLEEAEGAGTGPLLADLRAVLEWREGS